MHPLRKLLVFGTNKLLQQGLITLDVDGIDRRGVNKGHIFDQIAEKHSVILWREVGFHELQISVWWDYDHTKHPQANLQGSYQERFTTSTPLAKENKLPLFVGAVASGWLERKDSKHLQGIGRGGILDHYIRRSNRQELISLPDPKPMGYQLEGAFYM